MAQIAKISGKADIKCAPVKVYDFFKCNLPQLANMFPQILKSIQIVEGEVGQAGFVGHVDYVLGKSMTLKLKAEEINDGERSLKFRVLEGDVMQLYSSFGVKLTVNDGCANWDFEFEKNNDSAPNPDNYVKLGVEITQALDNYLLSI